MSKTINGTKWHNGREICRIVCNSLGDYGMAVVNWVDMSDRGIDPREDRRFNLQLVFTAVRAQRDGKFTTVVQMVGLQQDGRVGKLFDYICVPDGSPVNEEDIGALLHNVVGDDSEPQYTVVDAQNDGESGWYVSDGGYDMNIARYETTEWPFDGGKKKGHCMSWNEQRMKLDDLINDMSPDLLKTVVSVVEGFKEEIRKCHD